MAVPKIAISIGEPAGIGPDLIIKLCQNQQSLILITFCDPGLLKQRAKDLNLDINIVLITSSQILNTKILPAKSIYCLNSIDKLHKLDKLDRLNISKSNNINTIYKPGKLDEKTGINTLKYLDSAIKACLKNKCHALVTCPIQKSNIITTTKPFAGHTEYIEDLCNSYYKNNNYQSVMMLMSNKLKVALITTHIPVNKISQAITIEKIISIITTINNDLKDKFNITKPHIHLTGLNPHAGENGRLGKEELDTIIPAIKILQSKNIDITGPYPADSLFSKSFKEQDIVVAMYHDQGLTGFKAQSFNSSTNITMGIPIIRTSVDHGTALDLAGSGKISLGSIEYAIETAAQLAHKVKLSSLV